MEPGYQTEFTRMLKAQTVLPILRMDDAARCLRLAEMLHANGFEMLEITLGTPDACELISRLTAQGIPVGAGTVTGLSQAETALAHGARFLVSPGLCPAVAALARGAGVPYLPGVLTPTEVMQAIALDLTLLKLFPASLGGPAYLAQLQGPFPGLQWLVTGGVAFDEIPAWLKAGVLAIGYGQRIVSPRALAADDWNAVTAQLRMARARIDSWREGMNPVLA